MVHQEKPQRMLRLFCRTIPSGTDSHFAQALVFVSRGLVAKFSPQDWILDAPTDGAPKNALHESVGRFSYVDLYWENRHLVSGLPFLVYTSEYSISGLRMCLQNGGSAVSWKSELKSAKLDGVLQATEKGKLWQPGKYNEPAPEIVWCAQLPALFMVVVIKRWSVKNGK